ncbi:MAG: YciI family protein [Alphaproteobacteria bacterium]
MSDTLTWEHMLERTSAGPMLGKPLFVVFTYPADGMGPIQENIKEHLAYQRMLEDTGVMFAAGPMGDRGGETWSGSGMVVIRAENFAEAEKIAATDPMHAAGARNFHVQPWIVNEGTITVKVGFASGSREID